MSNRQEILEGIEEIFRNLQSREDQRLNDMFGRNSTELRAICSMLSDSESDNEFKRILETDFRKFLESFGEATNHGLVEDLHELDKMICSFERLVTLTTDLPIETEISHIISRLADYQMQVRQILR